MRGFVVAVTCLCIGTLHPPYAVAQDDRPVQVAAGPKFLAPARGAAVADATRWVDASRMPVLQQRLSVDLQGVSLGAALREVAGKGGLRITYSPNVLRAGKAVTLRAETITVGAALGALLYDAGVDVLLTAGDQAVIVARGQAAVVTGEIVGRVTDAKTGMPVARADLLLEKTSWRTTTDTSGWYRLASVDTGQYTLVVRRFGYTKRSQQLIVREGRTDTANVVLEPAAVPLNELVTTATGMQRRRDIGNAITTIRADSVMRTAPIRSLTDLLENRVPGMSLQHTSGAPGDPARIRLRGLGSVMRSNDPVVVVDGVRVYAAQAAARSGNLTNLVGSSLGVVRGAPAPSPLDQIDPNIIEKIDVLKGPSAATLYGADAANGVIVITTKRGKPGPTRWNANLTLGRDVTPGRWPTGYYNFGSNRGRGFPQICKLVDYAVCASDSLVHFQALNEPELSLLGHGRNTGASLTASGGTQALTYSVTGTYTTTTGLLKLPDYEVDRFRARFNRGVPDWMRRPQQFTEWGVASNVTARLGGTVDVTLGAMLKRRQQTRSSLENEIARATTTYVDRVNGLYYPVTAAGSLSGDSTYLREFYRRTTASDIDFTTTLNTEWRPRSWFTATGVAGLNVIPRDDQQLLPSGLVSATDSGAFARGTGQSLVGTFDLGGHIRRPLRWGFTFVTNVGVNLRTESTGDLAVAATGLVPGTGTIGPASRINAYEARASSSVFGWSIEPQIVGERLSLSTGIRLDGGSEYGVRLKGLGNLLALPKLNGTWTISEEPWFPFQGLFSSLRLRGAYGQAQVQPGPTDRLRLYQYTAADAGGVKLTTLGNTQLRPERSTEIEGGFDADLFESRLSLEVTVYRKTQVDALLPLTLPPSVNGGSAVPALINGGGQVVTNIGTIRNAGTDVILGLTPVSGSALTWRTELGYSRSDNTMVSLGNGVTPNPALGLVAGYPVGGRWDKWIVGFADEDGNGIIDPLEIRVSDSLAFLGRLLPTDKLMFSSNMRLFGGTVDVSTGFSYETGASQVSTDESSVLSRALFDPATPLNEQAAAIASTSFGRTQDVSTFRFNTFSVNYRAPRQLARLLGATQLSVALQGRNVAMHSSYRGKDPDVNAWAPGEGIQDTGQLPQPRTWQLRLDLQY